MAFGDITLPGVVRNLALDEALLLEADECGGPAVLRFWELPEHAVVLGATCPWRQAVRMDACLRDRVPLARRSSGGGTVVIGPGALNMTVVLPTMAHPALGAVDTTQAFVLGRCASAIRLAGMSVDVRGSGDLTIGDRKFSGSAQRRVKKHVLVHATILHDFDLARIARYLRAPRREPAYRAGRSHEDFLINLPLAKTKLQDAIRREWLGSSGRVREFVVPTERVKALIDERLGRPEWVEKF
jgi:lipoate-protein ligase A